MFFTKLGEKLFQLLDNEHGFKKDILAKIFLFPNGKLSNIHFVNKEKDSVQVVCITKQGEVVLVQQFRAGPEKELIELPGGSIEPPETPLDAGIRELREETGFLGDATYMGCNFYNPYSTGTRHCVLVINAIKVDEPHLDQDEHLLPLKISLRDFRTKIKNGDIRGWEDGYRCLDYIGRL